MTPPKHTIGSILFRTVLAFCALQSIATAGMVRWDVDATFMNQNGISSNGTATGYFYYDADTLTLGAYDVVTTGLVGAPYPGFTYDSSAGSTSGYAFNPGAFHPGIYLHYNDATAGGELFLIFVNSLTDAGGTEWVNNTFSAEQVTLHNLGNVQGNRFFVGGGTSTVTSVAIADTPEPATWGLGLSAFLAAVCAKRRLRLS